MILILSIMNFSRRMIFFFTGFIIGILILLFFSYTSHKRLLNIKKKKIVEKKDVKYFYNIKKTNSFKL
ncbi:hypothetical protein K645_206 [Blattabacterium sp. (Nauphoeta cinerea)]|nr:hypothetical protein K645_206 [Blattabacterium sp. (Nauphoeta cinerea)]